MADSAVKRGACANAQQSCCVLNCFQTCPAHHCRETLLLVDSRLVHGPAEPGAGSG